MFGISVAKMLNLLTSGLSATVDIIALVFVLCFALWGLIQGFTKTFFSAFGTIIALLIAVILAPLVAKFLQDKFYLITTTSGGISGALSGVFGEELMNASLSDVSDAYLREAGVGGFILSIILSFKGDATIPADTTLNKIICPTFAYYLVMILAVVILFIILKIIFFVISDIVKKSYEDKAVARFDRGLGCLLGLFNGIINFELIIMFISIIPLGFCQDVYMAVQTSIFANFLEDINLYGLIINAISSTNLLQVVKSVIIG